MELNVFIIFFMSALFGGIVSTTPPGPLNIRLLILFLKKEKSKLFAFQTGIILTDIICCVLMNLTAQQTLEANLFLSLEKKYFFIMQGVFIFMICVLGLRHIISAKTKIFNSNETLYEKKTHAKLMQYFIEGVVGTLTIPSLLPFWYLWWMGQKTSHKLPVLLVISSITLGVYLGDLFIFKIYRFIAAGFQNKILKINIAKIEVWSGYLLLIFASILLIKFFIFK